MRDICVQASSIWNLSVTYAHVRFPLAFLFLNLDHTERIFNFLFCIFSGVCLLKSNAFLSASLFFLFLYAFLGGGLYNLRGGAEQECLLFNIVKCEFASSLLLLSQLNCYSLSDQAKKNLTR